MVKANWAKLATIAELAVRAEAKKTLDLRKQEADLTQKRLRVDKANEDALTSFAGVHPAHWHSGDFHWQIWVSKNRERLGQQQAHLRAQVEIHRPELLKAFGRKVVIEEVSLKQTQ